MRDAYKVEVKLPVDELSVRQIGCVEKVLNEELMRRKPNYRSKSIFTHVPVANVSPEGLIYFSYNHGNTTLNNLPSPKITYEDAYHIVKSFIERLLIDDQVKLPQISFDTRFKTLIQGYALSEEEILKHIQAHPFRFRKPHWTARCFGQEFPSPQDLRHAKNDLQRKYCEESLEKNFQRLEEFSKSLLLSPDILKKAISECEEERQLSSVSEIAIPISFRDKISIQYNDEDVEVWFSLHDSDGYPREVSFQWHPEEGITHTMKVSTGRTHYLQDLFCGLEVRFNNCMEIVSLMETPLWVSRYDTKRLRYLSSFSM